jgi:hypothetical protein
VRPYNRALPLWCHGGVIGDDGSIVSTVPIIGIMNAEG